MPGEELNIYVLWGLRVALLLLLVSSPLAHASVSMGLDNAIVRFLLVIAIVLLIFVDPISSIIFVATVVILFMLSRKRSVHFNENPSIVESDESVEDVVSQKNENHNIDEMRGDTHSSNDVFTTPFQFHDVQSNLVGDETVQNTEVRTWDNELGPQGMGAIKGYNFFV